ncbi:MAG TPA: helix-turn-helix domain-containing protein, partial [Pirellulaceae bacterium]|nr:helix-turn-helix domain-containing protein [Pirellulaceae bacterium]
MSLTLGRDEYRLTLSAPLHALDLPPMSANASAQPQLLSRLNERSVMRVLQDHGPCSRADVSRRMNTSAPTVSKAVASLLRAGLLEEFDVKENGR